VDATAAASHRLAPLLEPRSVALVGASPRPGSFGNEMIRVLAEGGYAGAIHLVNPSYSEIDGRRCHPSLASLPQAVDLAVLGVAGTRLEAALGDAIAAGARAAVIFDSCYIEEDAEPKLLERLKRMAQAANLPVCGGNGMGFYNFAAATHVSFQSPPPGREAGGIALIAHSGSVFVLLADSDKRHRFNLIVSPGQEIGATVADYVDYAAGLPSTKVIALFLETVRDPAGFVAALKQARQRRIPIVALRVGRTEASSQFAATHSGAIAGSQSGLEALFDRYGVLAVDTLDELLATSLLLSTVGEAGDGALAMVTDSGGLREFVVDLAHDHSVPFAKLSDATLAKLAKILPHGLEPANPLDCAGPLRADFAEIFGHGLKLLLDDPATAVAAFEFDARDGFVYMPALIETAKAVPTRSRKPFLVLNSHAGSPNSRIAAELLDASVPLINGAGNALAAVKHLLAWRDFLRRPDMSPSMAPSAAASKWRERLREGGALGEIESLDLLSDFGIPTAAARHAQDLDEALAAAESLGYPVALKTAVPGINHKSDVGGVKLGIADADRLVEAWHDLAARLGPDMTVEPMIAAGVELAFGAVADPQFGPLVMVGAGGKLVELLNDRSFALAPFDAVAARRLLDSLRIRRLLDGVRGAPAVNIEALAETLAKFSMLAAELAGSFSEIDVNPIIAGPTGVMAVDALIVGGSVASEAPSRSGV
jgi:acyl-CoA synthetase (NDP forming)